MRSRTLVRSLRLFFVILAVTFLTASSSSAQTKKVIFHFVGAAGGQYPNGGLIFDGSGNLYGTTQGGGSSCACGVVYELSPTLGGWGETVLYTFNGPDGSFPTAGLVFDTHGNLYGATASGGASNDGTVFELTPTSTGWQEQVLYNFTGGSDGGGIAYGVVLDGAGNVYGTTSSGGANNQGVLFQLTSNAGTWTENVLLNFDSLSGTAPSPLAFDASGNLFGTAANGADGNHQKGTIYELTPTAGGWTQSIFYAFQRIYATGIEPDWGVALDGAGNLYGTTDGAVLLAGAGVAYKLTPSAQETVLERLQYGIFGGIRNSFTGPVTVDAAGDVYGAVYNQDNGAVQTYDGFVFKYSPSTGTTTYVFPSLLPVNKIYPLGGLAVDAQGNAYGATRPVFGNAISVIFKITF